MAERLIINNRTDKTMLEILPYIKGVLKEGRVGENGTQYCWSTIYTLYDKSKIQVISDLNKKSDRLTVMHLPAREKE